MRVRVMHRMFSDHVERFSLYIRIFGVVLAVPILLWKIWVLSVLWNWFLAEQLGAPHLSVLQAMGVALVWAALSQDIPRRYAMNKIVSPGLDENGAVVGEVLIGFCLPAILLAYGAALRYLL